MCILEHASLLWCSHWESREGLLFVLLFTNARLPPTAGRGSVRNLFLHSSIRIYETLGVIEYQPDTNPMYCFLLPDQFANG